MVLTLNTKDIINIMLRKFVHKHCKDVLDRWHNLKIICTIPNTVCIV